MNDYDVGQIMQEMEIELIRSMRRNLGRHMAWEEDEGFKWEQWQAKKIREIRKYRAKNMEIMASFSQRLNKATKNDLRRQYLEGGRKVDKEVSRIIKKGFSLYRATPSNDFFQGDNDKLDKLINAIRNDIKQAQYAALRQMDDIYRKTIFKAETFLGGGATTVDKAVDMALYDFLKAGINCVKYANGASINIASYARMAVRTANKRVFLMGEGERRKDWGLSLVLVSQYSACSPLCLPWQGRVYIDDVYSGGKAEDGEYPLLSTAIAGNLFHPNCRHTMSTYFPDITEVPEPLREDETGERYEAAQREAEINRNVQKYTRLKEGSLDPENVKKYAAKREEWKKKRSNESFASSTVPDFAGMTNDQIEDWTKKNLQTTFEGVEGANQEFVTDAIKVMSEFESKNGGQTIEGLKVKFGGTTKYEYAKYDDKTRTLLLKKTGSKSAFESAQKEENSRYKYKWKTATDYHATVTYAGTIWHELGHAVDIDTNQLLSRTLSSTVDLDEASVRISGYAGTTGNVRVSKRSEAWAENFAAYMEGGSKAKDVPSEIVDMIEKYFKKRR